MTSFDDNAIENSKKRLLDLCANENSSRFRRRQGPNKSAVNIDDMLRLLQEKGTRVPVFVARDLSRLPPITFDSVDVSSLIHSIRRAQLEIDQLKACVGGQRDATVDLTDVVKAVDCRLSSVQNLPLLLSRINGMMLTVMLSPVPWYPILCHWLGHSGLYWLLTPSQHHPRQLDNSWKYRNGRLSSVGHRSRLSRGFNLLPCSNLRLQ